MDQANSGTRDEVSDFLVGGRRTHRTLRALFAYLSISIDAKSVTTAVMGCEV